MSEYVLLARRGGVSPWADSLHRTHDDYLSLAQGGYPVVADLGRRLFEHGLIDGLLLVPAVEHFDIHPNGQLILDALKGREA